MTRIQLASDMKIVKADGGEMPIKVTHATIRIDYSRRAPVRATLEGFLLNDQGNIVIDVIEDMIVKGRDGKKYRMVRYIGDSAPDEEKPKLLNYYCGGACGWFVVACKDITQARAAARQEYGKSGEVRLATNDEVRQYMVQRVIGTYEP